MIRVRFKCGHGVEFADGAVPIDRCPTCGETVVAGVSAPSPRFTGHCAGPHATTKDLGPAIVPLGTHLPLKG